MVIGTAKAAGVRSQGRAAIAARTLRTDRWWAYPAVTFAVLLAFVAYATYAAIANRDYFAAPYISPFYSPCLSLHCGSVPGSHGVPHLGWFGTWWIVTPAVIIGEGLRQHLVGEECAQQVPHRADRAAAVRRGGQHAQ